MVTLGVINMLMSKKLEEWNTQISKSVLDNRCTEGLIIMDSKCIKEHHDEVPCSLASAGYSTVNYPFGKKYETLCQSAFRSIVCLKLTYVLRAKWNLSCWGYLSSSSPSWHS